MLHPLNYSPCDEDIKAKVKLVAIDEKWVLNIHLDLSRVDCLKNLMKIALLTIHSSPFLTVAITWSPYITRIPLPLLLKRKSRTSYPPSVDLFGGLTIHRLLLAFSSQDFKTAASCGSSMAEGITERKVLVMAVVYFH